MEDHEIAAYLRDRLWRRMSGPDQALVETVADMIPLTGIERQRFDHLKTQFAAEIANAPEFATR